MVSDSQKHIFSAECVLILVVMEYGLRPQIVTNVEMDAES